MSAHLCSPEHLSALANAPEQFARTYRLAEHTRDKIRRLDPLDDMYDTSEWDDATFLFYALLRENMRSLNHRYPDTAGENWTMVARHLLESFGATFATLDRSSRLPPCHPSRRKTRCFTQK